MAGLPRNDSTQAYIARNYEDIAAVCATGLDALIVTGANVANSRLELEPFYQPLAEVIGWASENVTSVKAESPASRLVQAARR